MSQHKDYESSFDADGNIKAWFWCDEKVYPFDFILELDWKCKQKFPNARITRIQVTPHTAVSHRVWWTVRWLKDGFKWGKKND